MSQFTELGRMLGVPANVHFAHPWLLLALLALPLLAWLRGARGGAPAVEFSSLDRIRALGRSAASRAGAFLSSLLYLGLAALCIALARPQTGRTITQTQASGIDIMICIDVSGSMLTEDYIDDSGQRVNRNQTIKEVTRKFIEARPNDRIGLVAFAFRPYLVSPLTLDHDWLLQNLHDRVRIGMMEDGTAIGSAIASAANRLKDRESKSKVVILLTDGDNNAGKIMPETAAEAAKALGVHLYCIGAGTNGVAPCPVFDPHTGQPVMGDDGKPVTEMEQVEFNETGLKRVAQTADGHYYRAADTQTMENVFKDIDKLEKSTIHYKKYQDYHDLYPWFLGAGLALIAVEMVLTQTVWRRLP